MGSVSLYGELQHRIHVDGYAVCQRPSHRRSYQYESFTEYISPLSALCITLFYRLVCHEVYEYDSDSKQISWP